MRTPVTGEAVSRERVSADRTNRSAPGALTTRDESHSPRRLQATTRIVLAILAVTFVRQIVLAVSYPPFEGHDEVAHYGYVATLDRAHRLPTLADNLPPETGPYSRFTLDWPAVYTANHPPLYYLLVWPLYRLAAPDVEARLYAMRLLSVPLFLLLIWLTYLLTLTVFPAERFLAVTAPALVAAQPQLSFEGAIVNNDILAIVMSAVILWLLADALRRGLTTSRALLLGTVLGLGLLTKATLTVFVPIVLAVAICCAYLHRRQSGVRRSWHWPAAANIAWIGLPAILVSLPWFVFVYATYGDLTMFSALDLLQAAWGAPSSSMLNLLLSPHFHAERLHEGWGYFGWRLLPLGHFELAFVTIVTALAIGGLALAAWRLWQRRSLLKHPPEQAATIWMLLATCAIFYLAMVFFGTRVAFTQMRYVFPAAPAAALLAALGFRALIADRWRSTGAAVIVASAMLFQLLVLTRIVLPHAMA